MKNNATVARKDTAGEGRVCTKPRYTQEENDLIYENWWNPKLRKELSHRFNRKISALRSQFCRLLKEKNISNEEYYKTMRAKYQVEGGQELLDGDEDEIILKVFAKHQALGSTRNDACEELRKLMQCNLSDAALKLRFYRLVQKRNLKEEDLYQLGQQVLRKMGVSLPTEAVGSEHVTNVSAESRSQWLTDYPEHKSIEPSSEREDSENISKEEPLASLPNELSITCQADDTGDRGDKPFLYQLAYLPESVKRLEAEVEEIKKFQRRQLDLRGFIEHLLAVERNLKQEDRLLEEIDRLQQENERIRASMLQEKERLERREKELTSVYELLNSMLADFMNLESVAKLASLGDFMTRLELTVDQFGTVLKSKRL